MQHPEILPLLILFFVIPFALLCIILKVVAFWKLCSRVGFSGPLGLLMLVPFGDIILPLVVAFAKWPAFEEKSKEFTQSQ